MSQRSERREADRLARKIAYKELRQQRALQSTQLSSADQPGSSPTQTPAEPTPPIEEPGSTPQPKPISEAQHNANRANSQHSSGPRTDAGKATSSMNALRHGLTGQAVLLPHEDATQYQRELDSYIANYQPVTDEELRLVQSLHDCAWRITRLQRLESGILLKGHLEFGSKFDDRPALERSHLIQAEAYLKYERQLRNLNIQEARLNRTAEKARLELARLKAIRRQQEQADLHAQQQAAKTATSQPNGFVFSTSPNNNPQSTPAPAINQQKAHSRAANGRNA